MVVLAAAFASLTLACDTLAQTVQPEQRLSTGGAYVDFEPRLSAAGTRIFGVWGGNDAAPHSLSYGYSLDRGATWVSEATLPLIWGAYGANPPFAVTVTPDGAAALMAPQSSHFYFRKPVLGSLAWLAPVEVGYAWGSEDVLQSLAGDPGANACYFSLTSRGTQSQTDYSSTIRFTRSLNDGDTWSAPTPLSSPDCNGSSLVVGPDGTLYVTWVDYVLGQIVLRRSTDHGATFSPPVAVAAMFDNLSAMPQGYWVPSGANPRNYPYYQLGVYSGQAAANFPALAVDRSSGPTRGWLYLVWADHADGAPAPAVTNYGEIEPANDSPQTAQLVTLDSDIYGSAYANPEGGAFDLDYYAFDGQAGESICLDGSNYGYALQHVSLYQLMPDGRWVRLAEVGMPGSETPDSHGKPAIVSLPRTGRYLLALGGGPGSWSYQVRLRRWNVAAGSVARDMRDIVLSRSTDGGQTWSPRVRVNSDPPGADQHQPNVAVDERGRVYVAWYDRRESEFGDTVVPYAAVSVDGGQTFGPDLRLAQATSNWVGPNIIYSSVYPGELVGDRIAIAAGDDYGVVAWSDAREVAGGLTMGMDVYAARIIDVPVAVAAVSDLVAEPQGNSVRLRWRVNDARGVAAIEVLRAEEAGPERLLGAATLSGAEGEAEYLDAAVEPGRIYGYRLRVTAGGASFHLGPATVQTPARIAVLACRASGPNPFTQRTAVTLAVPRGETGLVRVFDVQGKVVRTLHEGPLAAGEQSLEWDGRDAAGAEAAPGLYFVAAQVGAESARAKLTRVR